MNRTGCTGNQQGKVSQSRNPGQIKTGNSVNVADSNNRLFCRKAMVTGNIFFGQQNSLELGQGFHISVNNKWLSESFMYSSLFFTKV